VKFLADECCDALLVAGLRQAGHDVLFVMESARGADDATVLQQAASDQRILLTEDKDFGELVVRLGLPAYGIVLLRLNPADSAAKLARLQEVLLHDASRLPHFLVVVDADKARFRPLPTHLPAPVTN
jgi:predicted nuclease of predicted toxin-antitoxin system